MILAIIAAFAVPRLLRARVAANETSAIASLKTVGSAEVAYATSCGSNGYATSLVVLGTPMPGRVEAFISPDLGTVAAPQKSGYNFLLAAGAGAAAGPADCNGTATQTAYYATAVPATFGTTGTRSFALTAGNTIWEVNAAAAPTEPFGPPARPAQ